MEKRARPLRKIETYSTAIYLLALIIVACVIVYYRLQIQIVRGPGFDTYSFLANALNLAGKGGYFEIGRPPVLPLITSLFFRFGLDREITIYLIDAFFYVTGAAGLFLLLRMRFRNLPSFFASLLFLSFPDMVETVTFGITDVIAISMSVWLIFFTILAVNRNKRYFLVVFPLLIVVFLTRLTAALMIFPILLYLSLRENPLRTIKPIAQGLSIAGLLLAINVFYYWARTKGDPFIQFSAPFQVAATTTPAASQLISPGATRPVFFYVTDFPKFLGVGYLGFFFLGLFLLGVTSLLVRLIRSRERDKSVSAMIALALLAAVTIFLVFSKMNFLLVGVILLLLVAIVLPHFFDLTAEDLILDLLFAFWLLTFFSYQTHQAVKVPRYFITMAPAAAYLVALGLNTLLELPKKLGINRLYSTLLIGVVGIPVVALTALSASYSYKKVVDTGNWGAPGLRQSVDWLRPQLKPHSVVYADYFVATAWYLRKPVRAMPSFQDPRAFNHELEKYDADYYVSIGQSTDFPSYSVIKRFSGVAVFARNGKPLPNKPRLFFIGKGAHTYLEDLLDFKFYLVRQYVPFPDMVNRTTAVTYIDDYSLDELKKYPVLVLYNFRWRDIIKATKLIQDYLNQGGTLIIDASGNSGDGTYSLNGTDFLGVAVIPQELPVHPKISIQNKDLQRGVDTDKFASFVDEGGGPWGGSTYMRVPALGSNIEKSVTADGEILIGVQRFGKGRIIWVGHNFFFHAFHYKNRAEKRFIQNVFGLAFSTEKK